MSVDLGRVDLGPILRGEQPAAHPGIVCRDDGAGLFYPGALHDQHGEPGHGKSWLFFYAGAETLRNGGAFGILDFEGTPHGFVNRMRALGITDDVLDDRDRVAYHNLTGRFSPGVVSGLVDQFAAMRAQLVGIDAMLPALVRNGLDDNSNTDQARFFETITRPITETGAGVVAVDHLTRDPATRNRGARGGGAKLQLLDVSYLVKLTRPFSRTRQGGFKVVCQKDRHGIYAIGETVVEVDVIPEDGGRVVTIDVHAPKVTDPGAPFRPTRIMENISRALEQSGPLNTRALKSAAKGDDKVKPQAIGLLVVEGYVTRRSEGSALIYASVRPYREADEP